MPSMGLGYGLEKTDTVFKRKFRWLFRLPDISAYGTRSLPPEQAARPNVSFRENEVQHVTETIYYPGKPEWKSFNLVLYDIRCNDNPVFNWLRRLYDPKAGTYGFVVNENDSTLNFKQTATLEMYDGCGNCVEKWQYDNCWPQAVDFQDLDMGSSDILMADLTMRYDRAYVIDCLNENTLSTF